MFLNLNRETGENFSLFTKHVLWKSPHALSQFDVFHTYPFLRNSVAEFEQINRCAFVTVYQRCARISEYTLR